MKEIGPEELKTHQLEMLQKIHQYCVANNIHYSLAAGTLLGAIRHKGYIPWDDDIDILMPRPDYDRFLRNFNGFYPELEVLAPELNWNYYATYANVIDNRTLLVEKTVNHRDVEIGVKIDIFPIDGVPTDYDDYLAFSNKMKSLLQDISYKKWTKRNFIEAYNYSKKGFVVSIFKRLKISFISYVTLQRKYHDFAVSNSYHDAEYVENMVFNTTSKHWRLEKSCFEDFIEVSFENYSFYAMKGFDQYLKVSYGDYMQLPPKEQRIPIHGFIAYWK